MHKVKYPSLAKAKVISVDLETYDPELREKGPGVRRDGKIIGIGIGTDYGFREYYPIAHDGGGNLDAEKVLHWARVQLERPGINKVGANLLYDMDYLYQYGIKPSGLWYDVQVAEPLLNENRYKYSLDSLAEEHLGERKKMDPIQEECNRQGWKGDPRAHLWKMPGSLVREYGIGDVDLPIRILRKQIKKLKAEGLWDLFLMETELTPMLLDMRRLGVPIDEKKLDRVIRKTKSDLKKLKKHMVKEYGTDEVWAARALAMAFDKAGLSYPLTEKTKEPSFTKPWLEKQVHELPKLVLEVRSLDKFLNTFLIGQIKEMIINGRIHCQFNQAKGDQYGTVTGRFSSSNPNLQFIPTRDPVLGPLCRSLFVPDEDCDWGMADYSQVEFRIFAHYAMGIGSEQIRKAYNDNPDIDYHDWTAKESKMDRRSAKDINFGIIYGMGIVKTAEKLKSTIPEAKRFLSKYNAKVPFAKNTLNRFSSQAKYRGYVTTIMGRRRRFNYWEPIDWDLKKEIDASQDPQEVKDAIAEFVKASPKHPYRRGIERSGTYKALNAVIQGSAADVMKMAMVKLKRSGVLDILFTHLTVHDELDSSVPKTKKGESAFKEQHHIMEEAIKFNVPIIVDSVRGKNWGKVK